MRDFLKRRVEDALILGIATAVMLVVVLIVRVMG